MGRIALTHWLLLTESMSAYALPGLFPPLAASASSSKRGVYHAHEEKLDEPEVHVVVKEAKIDPARLVQSLTAPKQQPSQRRSNGCRRPRAPEAPCYSPQEESMEFELSVSFNGRTYTAVRTLPSILRLRDDLELETKDRCFQSSIPQVPRIQDEPSSEVTGRGGFSFLHALLRSYVPIVEDWLRKVTAVVSPSDSPSLTRFLWEPTTPQTPVRSHSSPAVHHLDSIEESEHDCDE